VPDDFPLVPKGAAGGENHFPLILDGFPRGAGPRGIQPEEFPLEAGGRSRVLDGFPRSPGPVPPWETDLPLGAGVPAPGGGGSDPGETGREVVAGRRPRGPDGSAAGENGRSRSSDARDPGPDRRGAVPASAGRGDGRQEGERRDGAGQPWVFFLAAADSRPASIILLTSWGVFWLRSASTFTRLTRTPGLAARTLRRSRSWARQGRHQEAQ
jgi:hypothetical protein